jgi:hypothetical protein
MVSRSFLPSSSEIFGPSPRILSFSLLLPLVVIRNYCRYAFLLIVMFSPSLAW